MIMVIKKKMRKRLNQKNQVLPKQLKIDKKRPQRYQRK
jgi:hypothetical protein